MIECKVALLLNNSRLLANNDNNIQKVKNVKALTDLSSFSPGSESVQGEELSNHEHPWENAECPGLSGETLNVQQRGLYI